MPPRYIAEFTVLVNQDSLPTDFYLMSSQIYREAAKAQVIDVIEKKDFYHYTLKGVYSLVEFHEKLEAEANGRA